MDSGRPGAEELSARRLAAIYCRTPHRLESLRHGVGEQERQCRVMADAIGAIVTSIYIDRYGVDWDPRRSARPGWRALLRAIRSGRLGHVFLDVPGLRQFAPCDVAELIRAVQRRAVVLHGRLGDADLDEATTGRLGAEAEAECRRRRRVGQVARSAHTVAAEAGRTHGGGRRRFGYTPDGDLVRAEVAIVRDVYQRFVAGESLRGAARRLNDRGVPTAYAGRWTPHLVARLIDLPLYAGLRAVSANSDDVGEGRYRKAEWPGCVTAELWHTAQQHRRRRSEKQAENRAQPRSYLLTGLLFCDLCGRPMVGSTVGEYPMYACSGKDLPPDRRCTQHIAATRLEDYVEQRVLASLSTLDDETDTAPVRGPVTWSPPCAVATRLARAPDPSRAWQRLGADGQRQVLRCLVGTVRISAKTTRRSVFDYGRIRFVLNEGT